MADRIHVNLLADYQETIIDPVQTGKRIRALRKSCEPKISQERLGFLVGVSTASISNWESGKDVPTTGNLIILSEIFKTPIDMMLVRCRQDERNGGGSDSAAVSASCLFFSACVSFAFPAA